MKTTIYLIVIRGLKHVCLCLKQVLKIFGPDYNCFTVAEDGETPLCIYHARDYEHAVGEPSVVPKQTPVHLKRL